MVPFCVVDSSRMLWSDGRLMPYAAFAYDSMCDMATVLSNVVDS
jgi:hypothetical protein